MELESFRLVNVVVSFSIAGTLSWRHFYYRLERGRDNRLRSLTSIAVFAVSAVISGVYYQRDVPASVLIVAMTAALTGYLVALWTPWRWRIRRR